MSQWLDDFRASLATVATGGPADQATKDAVAALKVQLDSNDASDADFKTAITELVTKLQNSTPA